MPEVRQVQRSTAFQKHKKNNKSTFVNLKHRICYTCRAKGHMGKDCPNGNELNSNLIHYDFTKLRKYKAGTCAIRVINFPQTSIRAIWVPKHLVSNLYGPNKVWVPKGTCWACRTMEMHWRLVLQEEILYLKMQPIASQHWRNIYFNGISLIRVNCHILATFSSLWTKVCHNSCSCETLESNFVSILSYPLLCAIWCFWHLSSREFVLCWNA